MVDLFNYFRRETTEVNIGAVPLGGPNSIRIQSMTNTSTQDTQACVDQAKRIVDAGGEYVRLTTQGIKEAENLMNINIGLRSQGYMVPLVADVHFNPKVADVAAQYAEKVRINPGNYVDAARTFKKLEYTDEEYAQEIQKIRDRFVPFLNICKENHTAIRIGVNHGSLSDRIMSRYGDTPEGMVESCMEFLRICVEEHFTDVVISIKASNTVVMVKTVRLLVALMEKEGMAFPLHLGVTEAGDGEEAVDIFFREKDIALIILDVMMPKMDGWEVCKTIRRYSQVPIIMLTAKSDERDELLGFELGIDEYITKPFSPKILVARVEAILRRSNGGSQDVIDVGGIHIDKTAHQVSVDGKPVDLSYKEFELMTYFAENQGIALSREKILNNVWNYDYFGDARTIDTHVKKLRSKLGEKGEYIKTIWGMGYKFEVSE